METQPKKVPENIHACLLAMGFREYHNGLYVWLTTFDPVLDLTATKPEEMLRQAAHFLISYGRERGKESLQEQIRELLGIS